MDRELIAEKLESLRRCIQRVSLKCPEKVEMLLNDFDLQDILALNLSRAVQLCVDIAAHLIADTEINAPSTMAETFDAMKNAGLIEDALATRLKKAVGFRNIAVHNYEAIDWAIVHSIARNHLSDFSGFAKSVQSQLDKG